MSSRPFALFLDRDGTLIRDKHYLSDPEGVELIPGTAEALRRARGLGCLLFLFTNQSGIGRGLYTLEDSMRCNARMEELIGLPSPLFDEVCIAPEAPDQPQEYRKPSPRFVLETIRRRELDPGDCWMVGDNVADMQAGLNAGIRIAAVCTGKLGAEQWNALALPDLAVFPSLLEFVAHLERLRRNTRAERSRLDELVVSRGLAETRTQAQALIMSGRVMHGTERLDKPGRRVAADIELTLEALPRFVSRGGEKLAAAIERFALDVRGVHVLDVGASTGGFTDCVLQAGAADVVCIDVGRAQLHARLRADPRVTNIEKLNARFLDAADLPRRAFDLVVMDVSFISLTLVLGPVWPFLRHGGVLVALVKPQFEAGRPEVDKGRGVIRDPAVRDAAVDRVRTFALAELGGAEPIGTMESPFAGADGNREFLIALRKAEPTAQGAD